MRDPATITFGPQQAWVLQLAAAGHSDKEIAREIGASQATVRKHIARLCEKLGASPTDASSAPLPRS